MSKQCNVDLLDDLILCFKSNDVDGVKILLNAAAQDKEAPTKKNTYNTTTDKDDDESFYSLYCAALPYIF